MEQHYNSAEPMGLSLSGVMTFFFGGIYFQYHINDIMKRKMMDQMYGDKVGGKAMASPRTRRLKLDHETLDAAL